MKFAQALLLGLVQQADALQDECNALIMSGGASKGSYEAGVLYGMYHNAEDKSKFEYDVISGVSAGAINAGFLALFDKNETEQSLEVASQAWQNLTTLQVYRPWFTLFPIYNGIFEKSGILDTTPLHNLLDKFVKQFGSTPKRDVFFGAVDATSGSYIVFDRNTPEYTKAILSSASMPAAFPTQAWQLNGQKVTAFDGGSVWNINIASAIDACRQKVGEGNDKKINLDIILCGDLTPLKWDGIQDSAYANYQRFKDLKDAHSSGNSFYWALQAYPEVNFRYFIEPSDEKQMAQGGNSLLFSNKVTWPMQLLGRKDGENAIKQGEGVSFKKFKESLIY